MSASSFASAMLEHRVEVAATDASSTSAYWFPLPRLARFSTAVSADAPPEEVKRAMAEAKAAISAACKQHGVALDTAYRKIGATVCVSEDGFQISVQSWAHSRESDQLQAFVSELPETTRSIFHPHDEVSSAEADADIDLPADLQAQIAEEVAPPEHLESDAPSADFSFAAAAAAAAASAPIEAQADSATAAPLLHPVAETIAEPVFVESKESRENSAEILPVPPPEKRRLSASRLAKPAAAPQAAAAAAVAAVPAASQPPAPTAPAAPCPALRQLLSKYAAPVAATSSAQPTISPAAAKNNTSSASLSAPPGQFSLAAFLDHHLHTPTTGAAKNHSTLGQLQQASLIRTLSDLTTLTSHWSASLSHALQTNPAEVAREKQRVEFWTDRIESVGEQHAHVRQRLHAHVESSSPMRTKVGILQRNMCFLQHVREYEGLLRQAQELSERCREDLMHVQESLQSGTTSSSTASKKSSKPSDPSSSAPSAGAGTSTSTLQSICVSFLKLLRLYQGLRQATRLHTSKVGEDKQLQAAWAGVPHLQSLVRQRLLTILRPLQSKLIQLYQQTLVELNWPQTTNTLLLGLHANPLAGRGSPGPASQVTSPSTGSTSSSSSSASASPLTAALSLFELLSENLIRVQMLLVECGMAREVRRVEREIQLGTAAADGRDKGHQEDEEDSEEEEEEEKQEEKKRDRAHPRGSTPARPPRVTRLWVLTLLLQPLYKRFHFHFDSTPPTIGEEVLPSGGEDGSGGAGGKAAIGADASSATSSAAASSSSSSSGGVLTNRLDKPDWILTFLERSFSDHRDFLERLVQPIVNACGWREGYETGARSMDHTGSAFLSGGHYDVCLEFLERLLSFYHAKLSRPSTLHALVSSPPLLRLTLNELMAFEHRIAALYDYPIYSSRRLSLVSVFLLHPDAFQAVVKQEKEMVNRGFDRIRRMKRPWERVLTAAAGGTRGGAGGEDGGDGEDDLDGPSTSSSILSFDDPSSMLTSSDASFLHTSSATTSATHGAHAFLTLVDRLTGRYRSFKYLHTRLHCLKEVQFKLFEIFEEDLIREFQENWTKLQENAKRGGIAKLTLMDRAVSEEEGAGEDPDASEADHSSKKAGLSSSKYAVVNPLPLWSKHCGLLNSIHYIIGILKEWDDQMLFLELYFYYTHRTKIQAAFLQAHKAARKDPVHAPPPIGGIYVPPALSHSGEEEVLLTSEELAMWMANGGSAVGLTRNAAVGGVTDKAAQSDAASDSVEASSAAALLPAEFRRTLAEFDSLAKVINSTGNAGGPAIGGSPTPTAPTQLTRSTSARSTTVDSSTAAPLPLDLSISGTLFSPILAGYSALLSEMLHVLASQIVTHFRTGIKARGYIDEGHLSAGRMIQPHLRIVRGRPLFTWATLYHEVELSPKICQPLVDLKMQLLVVSRHLSSSLHRTFWSSLSSRLSPAFYDDTVSGKFFSRSGALRWMREARAVWEVCGVFQQQGGANTAASPVSGPLLNPHFKLLSDTINILLLNRTQLEELDFELTQGSVAASSASLLRAYLSKEPYLLQKMSAQQVIDLIIHMRVEEQDQEEVQEQQAEEAHEQQDEDQDDDPSEYPQEYMDDLHLAAGEERRLRRNAGEEGHDETEQEQEQAQEEYADGDAVNQEEYDQQQEEEQQQYADEQPDGQEQESDQGEQYEDDQQLEQEQQPLEGDQPQCADDFQDDFHPPAPSDVEASTVAVDPDDSQPDELNLDDFGGFPEAPLEDEHPEEEEKDQKEEAYDLR
jgi:hypothetical protein